MKTLKKSLISLLLLTIVTYIFCFPKVLANAVEKDLNYNEEPEIDQESIQPNLFATLSFTINGGGGRIWVTARNDFTLFPSTVQVVVQLYSSVEYYEDYQKMEMVANNSTLDLDMGTEIVAEASTNGVQKYWIGRMRYLEGNKDWKEKTLGPILFNGNGEYIGNSK